MVKKVLAVVLPLVVWGRHGGPKWFELSAQYTFEEYVGHFGKEYRSSEEHAERGVIFARNLVKILAHNANRSKTWKMGVNSLTDWREEEIDKYKKGLAKSPFVSAANQPADGKRPGLFVGNELPLAVDWRANGTIVTAVKNQGSCGSCWAFASTETIESHVALNTGSLFEFAPQEFVDCAANPKDCGGTGGCEGATAEIAYSTAMKYGMFLESDLPYQGADGECVDTPTPVANVTGWVRLPRNNYSSLLEAVATLGPIAISVDASWSGYESGIFPAEDGGTDIDHAVQLVGYGSENGTDYWLVRNSWGPDWGEDGYIRLERTADGLPCAVDTNNQDGVGCAIDPVNVTVCGTSGILYDSSYPTGAYLL